MRTGLCEQKRGSRAQRGQATLELCVLTTLLVLLLLGIVASIEAVHAQIAVNAVALEGVKTCVEATSERACWYRGLAAARDVASSWHLKEEDLTISVDSGGFGRGAIASCTVTYTVHFVGFPVLQALPPLHRTEHMQVQLYGNR